MAFEKFFLKFFFFLWNYSLTPESEISQFFRFVQYLPTPELEIFVWTVHWHLSWKYSYELFTDTKVRNMMGRIKNKGEKEKGEHILSNFRQN
jgi:hypothetical protein